MGKPVIVNVERWNTKVLPTITRLIDLGFEMHIVSCFRNKTHWRYYSRELVELEFRHKCLGHIMYNFALNYYTFYKISPELYNLSNKSTQFTDHKLWDRDYLFGENGDYHE